MKKTTIHIKPAIVLIMLVVLSCSTEKNTWLTRSYHNLTAHYNVYFNGREAYRKGMQRIEDQYTFDFTRRLPVYLTGIEETAQSSVSDMDKAIKKASKTIKYHSIKAKPKQKDGRQSESEKEFMNKNEYNKWVDDAYLLMGKAYFVKNEFLPARQNFEYIIREFPKEPVRFEAMLMLGRTALATGNLKGTKKWIDQIDGEDEFPEDLQAEWEILNAAYYLELNNPDRAIPHLKKAIEENDNKSQRIRHRYILAQLYKDQGEFRKAAEMFETVNKKSDDYEMGFNAKINMAECYGKLGGSYKDMRKLLSKMIKDDKNIEYLDQVYYALAEVEYKNGNREEGIKNYKLSSEHSSTNNNQKALSCMRLGDIYYEEPDYRLSQAYYDTCMLNLSNSHPRYNEIKDLSRNLSDLVNSLDIVETQDSLQAMANMSEAERNKIIDKEIQAIIEEEKRQQEMERQQQENSMLFDERRGSNRTNAPSGGKWYFYNPATLSHGSNEFQKKWGNRKLEDHWRRSNKSSVSSDQIESDTTGADSLAGPKVTDNKSREYYLQDVPLNDSLMEISNEKIMDALFSAGNIYMDKFKDYDRAIETFGELNSRYPEHDYKLLTYYNLYELHNNKNEVSQAETFKQKVIENFPDSNYAKILENPNYVQELLAREEKEKQAYEAMYNAYRAGKLTQANQMAADFYETYPDSEITDKVKFIDLMASALNMEQIELKQELARYIQNYPESPLSNRASDILSYLGESDVDALLADLESRPEVVREESTDTSRRETDAPEAEETIYEHAPDETHYYMVSANTKNVDTKQLRFEISNFNIFTFNITTFRVLYYMIDEDEELVFVRSFKSEQQAANYMNLIENNQNVFGDLNPEDYEQFIISESNYDKLKKAKDVDEYLEFYRNNYLNE